MGTPRTHPSPSPPRAAPSRVSLFTSSEVQRLSAAPAASAADPHVGGGNGEAPSTVLLHFGNGTSAVARRVILNLPAQPLLALLRRSTNVTAAAAVSSSSSLPALHHAKTRLLAATGTCIRIHMPCL